MFAAIVLPALAHAHARALASDPLVELPRALGRAAALRESGDLRAIDVASVALAARSEPGDALASRESAGLAVARSLLAARDAGAGDAALVRLALAGETTLLGLAPDAVPVDRSSRPSDALARLANVSGAPFTVRDRADALRLDAVGEPARGALTTFVDDFAVFERVSIEAWRPLESDAHATLDPPALARVLATRGSLVDATFALRDALAATDLSTFAACAPATSGSTYSIDLSTCDETYTKAYELTIDAGGNDVYLNNAGGTGRQDCLSLGTGFFAAAAVDFGGDDVYGDGGSCGVNGGGVLGAGLLVDTAGDDRYVAGVGGVNGGAYHGALVDFFHSPPIGSPPVTSLGLLVDVAGNDTYSTNGCGGNGGGFYTGAGALIDLGGDDRYLAPADGRCTAPEALIEGILYGAHGANGGGTEGLGFLVDLAGDDVYKGAGEGVNGGAADAPSAGFLLDGGGSDLYEVDATSTNLPPWTSIEGVNGGTYGRGTGLLVDAAGDDRYVAHASEADAWGGANGGAANGMLGGGIGMLVDARGDDRYEADGNGANGGAYVLGSGFLVDLLGDDVYSAGSQGTNGGAYLPPMHTLGGPVPQGLLLDATGSDSYTALDDGTNGGAIGGVAALIDLEGNDHYDAGKHGVNGGGDASTVSSLLYDGSGRDAYRDGDGGSGVDVTVYEKGTVVSEQVDEQASFGLPEFIPAK